MLDAPWSSFQDSSRPLFLRESGEISYSEFFSMVECWSLRLAACGVGHSDKVAVVGDFSAYGTALVLALLSRGNTIIPFSQTSSVELFSAVSVSGCDWLIRIDETKEIESQAVEEYKVLVDHLLFRKLFERRHSGLVLYSSGTSGRPKAILHDLNKVIERFQPSSKRFVSVPMLMFDHFGGYNTIFSLLSSESSIAEVRSRSVEDICATIQKFSVTLLPTSPSFLSILLMSNAHNRFDLSSLRKITYGTEPMNPTLLERITKVFPDVKLQQTYGLSEVGVPSTRSESNSSTRVAIGGPGFETKVVDGVLWIRSEFAMLGYLNQDDQNSFVDGWFNTKDKVVEDGEYVRIVGREADQINVGGQKVLPIEVEETILTLEEVADVQAYGESNALVGQVVAVDVLLKEDALVAGMREIIKRHCQERLAKFKVPQRINFVAELKMSGRGKRLPRRLGIQSEDEIGDSQE